MTLTRISLAYLKRRALSTTLNVTLLAFAVAAVTLLVITRAQLEERIVRDTAGIDLVVGAKGSQAQIVLSSLYGIDAPTGDIPWSLAQEVAGLPGVARAIPLALGDSYRGFRIAGTSPYYVTQYGGVVSRGRLWQRPLEAVLGADVAQRLRPPLDSSFVPAHGLKTDAPQPHEGHAYRVVGVLAYTGTVLDRLILTDLQSYWTLHPVRTEVEESELVSEPPLDDGRTVSAVLIQYAGGGAGALPQRLNGYAELQAASPKEETARLFGVLAVGMELLRGFALVLMFSAALSISIALYNGLFERRYDIAVMRTLGATREHIMGLMLFEGLLLAVAGTALGLLLGHAFTSGLGYALTQAQHISVTGWTWYAEELWVVLLALAIGVATALVPAWRAHEIDIAGTLARG